MTVCKPELKSFCQQAKRTEKKFKFRTRDYDKDRFAGIKIESTPNGFEVLQKHYFSKIKNIIKEASFKECHSLRAQLSWATQSRPDIA